MSKESVVELEGIVLECLPSARFKVQLQPSGTVIDAHIAGKLRKFQIRLLTGDRVTVELSPYDLTKGRITFRNKASSIVESKPE